MKRTSLFVAGLLLSVTSAGAQDSGLPAFISDGKIVGNARYRFESVDQANLARTASASTFRTRLGFETGAVSGFRAYADFESIVHLGDDRFNDTVNGKGSFPVVADPEALELNQAYLSYGSEFISFKAGRQRIIHDGARFIGNVGFRQNEQTYDAVEVKAVPLEGWEASYGYLWKVHRIFGDQNAAGEFDSNSHMLRLDGQVPGGIKTTAYAYLLDLSAAALSTQTYGLSASAAPKLSDDWTLTARLEYAHQSDFADNPFDLSLDYLGAEVGLGTGPFKFALGYEGLDGNGQRGFSTPLATLHKFQGFADVFLVTPASGIDDIYVTASYALPKASWYQGGRLAVWYHDFSAQQGGDSLGSEFNALAAMRVTTNVSVEAKLALYDGTSTLPSRDKFWFAVTYAF